MTKEMKTQWHPAFCSAMRLEFREYAEYLEYINEFNLTRKPLQIDLLIIKKKKDIVINNGMGRVFRKHNIIEYKSPDDSMNEDIFLKVVGYACLYKAGEQRVGDIDTNDISITLIRKRYPRKLFQWLQEKNFIVYENKQDRGIYYVEGVMGFSVQIVVTQSLSTDEQKWITLLNSQLSKHEAKRAVFQSKMLRNKDEKEYADSILQVIVSENRAVFDMVKREEIEMCEALRELMEPEFSEEKRKAAEQGRIEGTIDTLKKIGRTKNEIVSYVMEEFNLSEMEVIQYMK